MADLVWMKGEQPMTYEMRDEKGKLSYRGWDDPGCFPTKRMMEAMYSSGQRLYINGKKQTKADALAAVPKKLNADKKGDAI